MWSISLLGCFLFKQKTAYEMRISDWSSDVCSSDLDLCRIAREVAARGESGREGDIARSLAPPHAGLGAALGAAAARRDESGRSRQIGRASCRERVCKYV